jgi:urease beta subunit
MAKRKLEMEIINPNAAGIDIGSRSHFVAINQDLKERFEFSSSVRLFKVCLASQDLR